MIREAPTVNRYVEEAETERQYQQHLSALKKMKPSINSHNNDSKTKEKNPNHRVRIFNAQVQKKGTKKEKASEIPHRELPEFNIFSARPDYNNKPSLSSSSESKKKRVPQTARAPISRQANAKANEKPAKNAEKNKNSELSIESVRAQRRTPESARPQRPSTEIGTKPKQKALQRQQKSQVLTTKQTRTKSSIAGTNTNAKRSLNEQQRTPRRTNVDPKIRKQRSSDVKIEKGGIKTTPSMEQKKIAQAKTNPTQNQKTDKNVPLVPVYAESMPKVTYGADMWDTSDDDDYSDEDINTKAEKSTHNESNTVENDSIDNDFVCSSESSNDCDF